jgi:hypothetical protein
VLDRPCIGQQVMAWSKKAASQEPPLVWGQKVVRVGHEPPRVRHSWAPERAEGGVEGEAIPMTCKAARDGVSRVR